VCDQDDPIELAACKRRASFEHLFMVIQELLETERDFLYSVTDANDLYMIPLTTRVSTTKTEKFIKLVIELFSNLPQVQKLSTKLHEDLFAANARLQLGKVDEEYNEELIDQEFLEIANIFISFAKKLPEAYCPYISSYAGKLDLLSKIVKEDPLYKEVAATAYAQEIVRDKQRGGQRGGHSLDSLLIMPVQRPPRYILLITEIIKLTPASFPSRDRLSQALLAVKKSVQICNSESAFAETVLKVQGVDPLINSELAKQIVQTGSGVASGPAKVVYLAPGDKPTKVNLLFFNTYAIISSDKENKFHTGFQIHQGDGHVVRLLPVETQTITARMGTFSFLAKKMITDFGFKVIGQDNHEYIFFVDSEMALRTWVR